MYRILSDLKSLLKTGRFGNISDKTYDHSYFDYIQSRDNFGICLLIDIEKEIFQFVI